MAVKAAYPGYGLLFVNGLDDFSKPLFEVGLLNGDQFLLVDVKDNRVTPVRSFVYQQKE